MKTYCLVCKKLTDNTNLKTVKKKKSKTNDEVYFSSVWK